MSSIRKNVIVLLVYIWVCIEHFYALNFYLILGCFECNVQRIYFETVNSLRDSNICSLIIGAWKVCKVSVFEKRQHFGNFKIFMGISRYLCIMASNLKMHHGGSYWHFVEADRREVRDEIATFF